MDDSAFSKALKECQSTREIFFLVRDSIPVANKRQVEDHANKIISHYMNNGEAGKAQLLYIALKALAMQEDGLL